MVTLRDVADRAGVGVSTVSRTLNDSGYVDATTRERVLEAIAELKYRPNAIARALRARRTGIIGFIVPDLRNQFYAEGSSVLQRTLTENGYQLVVGVSDDSADAEMQILQTFRAQQVDGVVAIPSGAASVEAASGMPLVEMNRRSEPLHVDAVIADEQRGVRELTRILLEAGHRQIALIIGPSNRSTTVDRRAGFEEAAGGVTGTVTEVLEGSYTPAWGRQAARRILDSTVTGVVVASSQIMEGFLEVCREQEIRIPQRLSVVSLGDPPWFRLWTPALTTYAPDLGEMGRIAANRLLWRIDPEHHDAQPELLVVPGRIENRESVAAPPSSA